MDMLLSLSHAADLAGVSKSALFKAIKRGRLSAVRDDVTGEWRVDVRELERVYTLVTKPVTEHSPARNESAPVSADHVHYEARIAALESERDYLRQALEREADDRRQLMRLLPGPQPSADKSARTAWTWVLLALVALGAVAWGWFAAR